MEFWEGKLKNSKIIGLNINIENISVYNILFRKRIYNNSNISINKDYLKAIREYKEKLLKLLEEIKPNFDIIYCYDWLTLPAAIEIKKRYNKPLVLHLHSTAYDRTGANADVLKYLEDYYIEKEGCKIADKIIVVSKRMKDILVKYYRCDENKIYVVYNAPDDNMEIRRISNWPEIKKKYKIVLYLGRITMHKGPDWLLKAAKLILDKRKDILFIFAGTGEMLETLIKMAAELKISRNVIFTGWVDDNLAEFLYDISDVFVLPSVSEPFGLTPFEALAKGKAIIITKQTGVAEVLKSAAKVDFWDTQKMANYILGLLDYETLRDYEIEKCLEEMKKLSWEQSVRRILDILSSTI